MSRTEKWQAVPGYEGCYEVSDLGRVRSLPRSYLTSSGRRVTVKGGIRKTSLSRGYERLVLCNRNGESATLSVHRLVLAAFVGPCPDGMEACHANSVRDDNRVENLRWDTPSANSLDNVINGTHPGTKKTSCKRGHPLSGPNLLTLRKGRGCRACSYEATRAHELSRPFSEPEADRHYERYMTVGVRKMHRSASRDE